MKKLHTFLLEADLVSKIPELKAIIKKAYPNFTDIQVQEMIDMVNRADPTGEQGSYTSWLINQIIKENLSQDQFGTEEIKKTLQLFHKNRVRPTWVESRAIQDYTWQTLKTTIEQLKADGILREDTGAVE